MEGPAEFDGSPVSREEGAPIVRAAPAVDPATRLREDVHAGLSRKPKVLSSVHLYDARGSELFRRIMELPEYYVTRVEREILERHGRAILRPLLDAGPALDVIDLGAGDGSKTRALLQFGAAAAARLRLLPIDVSEHALRDALAACREQLPWLRAQGVLGEYADGIAWLSRRDPGRRRLVLMLGSNVGNMTRPQTRRFFRALRRALLPGDHLLVGFDLLKDPALLQRAYDDARGVTAEFNLNLLRRINRELDGDFDLRAFRHLPVFSPGRRAMESYLISLRAQTVQVAGVRHRFEAWEPIRTETSFKYRRAEISGFARAAGFVELAQLGDERGYFVDALWRIGTETSGGRP